ncbi:MAG: hypothetical protein ABIK99_01650 [candidate division WOR-3 bacterium]
MKNIQIINKIHILTMVRFYFDERRCESFSIFQIIMPSALISASG